MLKFITKLSSFFFKAGGYFKLRYLYEKEQPLRQLLLPPVNSPQPLSQSERVLVVGSGISAFSLLKGLKSAGHEAVKIVTRDQAFGGKCVNYGCMPSEYFAAKQHLSAGDRVKSAKEVIGKLRSITEESFRGLGYSIGQGNVQEISGNTAILDNGEKIEFDRVVLATGNQVQAPADLGEIFPLERFWELEQGQLVIVSDHNLSSLSYADIAHDQGMSVTVVFAKPLAINHLPSFQFFQKSLTRKGVKIIFGAKGVERQGQTLKVTHGTKTVEIPFTTLVYNGSPNLRLPKVDGKEISILDVDYTSSSIKGRDNVYVAGDASGLLAASEAEFQAHQILESWRTGTAIDLRQFEQLPYRLHASLPLAMVGPAWSLLEREWRSVDFKNLGWSLLHGEEGKLWYLYDETSDKVEAVHICHRNASDLITLAAVLIDVPLTDRRWLTSFVHPSSFEIFKVIVEDLEPIRQKHRAAADISPTQSRNEYVLPPLSELDTSPFFRENFTEAERRLAVLDPNPAQYLGMIFGVKQIMQHLDNSAQNTQHARLIRTPEGRYHLQNGDEITFFSNCQNSVVVILNGQRVSIRNG